MAQAHESPTSPRTGRRPRPVEHAHPGPKEYVKIAIVLAIITAAEVGVYYVEPITESAIFVPLLIFMSVVKFALVALYFMHLRFDSRVFRRFFVTGIVLAIAVYTVVLLTFAFKPSTN